MQFQYLCHDTGIIFDPTLPLTILDAAFEEGFTLILTAILQVELANTLTGPGPFTFFCPSNPAVQTTIFTNFGISLEESLQLDILADIVGIHVVPGENQPLIQHTYLSLLRSFNDF